MVQRAVVIGCGNLLRGDDAAGPAVVQRLRDRGLPEGVGCVDGGPGLDVVFQMRDVPRVILVDACATGSEPGTLFEVSGGDVQALPPFAGVDLHAFRWDHAIAFAHRLLGNHHPAEITAYLIEGERFDAGADLSPSVAAAVDRLTSFLLETLAPAKPPA